MENKNLDNSQVQNNQTTEPTVKSTANEPTTKEPFKVFNSQSEFDSFVQQTLKTREENIRKKLTPEIREQLEKEATMTIEDRLQAQIDALEKEKEKVAIERNRNKSEQLFVSKGISNGYEDILNLVVNSDEETTINQTTKLLELIDTLSNQRADEKIKSTMKQIQLPQINHKEKEEEQGVAYARKLGKIESDSHKSLSELLKKHYL